MSSRFSGAKELLSFVTTFPEAENSLSAEAEEAVTHKYFLGSEMSEVQTSHCPSEQSNSPCTHKHSAIASQNGPLPSIKNYLFLSLSFRK